MCVICKEYIKGSLTSAEALDAIGEVLVTSGGITLEHVNEIVDLVKGDENGKRSINKPN